MSPALFDRATRHLLRSANFRERPNRRRGRRVAAGIGLTVGAVLVIFGVVVVATARPTKQSAPRGQPRAQTVLPAAMPVGSGLSWQTLTTVTATGTPVQEEYDQAFSQGLGHQPGMATAAALEVPAPAIADGWPRLGVQNTPEAWAAEFVSGLLDVTFAHQSRAAVAPWLQAEEAPELIPGIPSTVADKVLYISLLEPGVFGGQPTPIPSPGQWQADVRGEVSQSVGGLLVQADPSWAQMVAAGWQPSDVRMTEEDVSGTVTVRRGGDVVGTDHFGLQLIVGSSRWHEGYGTVAVAAWTES